MKTCPACNKESSSDTECTHCGIYFDKWQALHGGAAPGAAPVGPAVLSSPPVGGSKKYLIFLGLVAVGVGGYYAWQVRRAASNVLPGAEGVAGLDPERYREHIEPIERAVYREGPPLREDAELVSERTWDLMMALAALPRLRNSPELAQLDTFGAAINGSMQGLTMDPMARKEWIRLWELARGALFAPAPWFHPPLAVNEAAEPAAPSDAALALQAVDAQLAALISAARTELADLGESDVNLANMNQPDMEWRLERWRAWAPGWIARVDQVQSSFPPFVRMPSRGFQDAHRLLERVCLHLKELPSPGAGVFLDPSDPNFKALYLPRRQYREGWLEQAEFWMGQALDMIKSGSI